MRIALLEDTLFPYLPRVEVVSPWGVSHLFALLKRPLFSGGGPVIMTAFWAVSQGS